MAGRGETVDPTGERGRDPDLSPVWGCDDLQVDTMTAVFSGAVGPAVADPLALGERPVGQGIAGFGVPKRCGETGCPVGQQRDDAMDVGVAVPTLIPKPAAIWWTMLFFPRYTSAARTRPDSRSWHHLSPSQVTVSIVTHSASACGTSSTTR